MESSVHRTPKSPAKPSIVFWLAMAIAALLLLLAALAALTLTGIRSSNAEILRAEQSLTQLENVRAVEAAFDRYLLGEIQRRLRGSPDPAESEAAGILRGALLAYRRTIGEEIAAGANDGERAAERVEMVRASALAEIFETIETESMIERVRRTGNAGVDDARSFLAQIAAERDRVFHAVVFEVLADERAEAASSFRRLEALRSQYLTAGSVLAAFFLAAVLAFGYLFYRGLMRPIRRLALAVEAVPSQSGVLQAPEDLPGEFAALARRFNAMSARIATEQQRLQAEVDARTADLAAANASLRRIDEARRTFFANISHELRTPVTVLLGEAQIALRGSGGERAALERIAATCGFLRRRLDDLLELARSEDGELRLQREPMELTEAIADAVGAIEAFAAANEITLALERGPEVPLVGDREALRQAALALIDNAIKFSPPGGRVTVRTTAAGFAVEDSGPGFGSADPEELFARYVQTDEGRRRGGAGLGLAIVKWVADQHGARILTEDSPDGGARISLEFDR